METTISALTPEQLQIQALTNALQILETTNQQLSLWYNPYGLILGILTFLLGLLAIAVSYALWKNSKEQKDLAKSFFDEQTRLINEKNESVKLVETKMDELIKQYEKQLKNSKNDTKEVQKIIDELKKEKATIGGYMGPSVVTYSGYTGPPSGIYSVGPGISSTASWMSAANSTMHRLCNKCGNTFTYVPPQSVTWSVLSSGAPQTVFCPHCGEKNIL